MSRIFAACLACCLLLVSGAGAQDLSVSGMLDQMKEEMDLGFKQQDAIKPILGQYVKVIQLLREQNGGNEKLLKGQIQVMNQQLERELKGVLSPEQMDAFRSIRRSVLAS